MKPRFPLLLLLLLGFTSCTNEKPADITTTPPATEASSHPGSRPVHMDGDLDEWEAGELVRADGQYIYIRLNTDASFTLQGGQQTSTLQLDADAPPSDVQVVFSGPGRDQNPRAGVRVSARINGEMQDVGHSAIDLSFAPVFASNSYEVRIARDLTLEEPLRSTWKNARTLTGEFDVGGKMQPFSLDLPPLEAMDTSEGGVIPSRPRNTVRVVSWNIERAAPRENPEPFSRILNTLNPDVVLIQEWWRTSEEELLAWMSAHVASETPWRAVTFGELGVAVLSRLPTTPLAMEPLMPSRQVGQKRMRPIRFVSALVETSQGPLVVASLHLKSSGAKGTWEDELRQVEARAINQFLEKYSSENPATPLLVAGDYNLVGTDLPLTILAAGLDADHSDLESVEAIVLGDSAEYTWTKDRASFTPGRLDFALHSDSATRARQAFVMDTELLDPEFRTDHELLPDDSRASDHLPLVIDLDLDDDSQAVITPVNAAQLLEVVKSADHDAVIVNFWASWCVPCVKELPDLLESVADHDDQIALLLVTFDDDDQLPKAREILNRMNVTFPTFQKSGKDIPFLEGIDPNWDGAIPLTIVYDRSGNEVASHQGQASRQEFNEMILGALNSRTSERSN